jgi:hypothetical protein
MTSVGLLDRQRSMRARHVVVFIFPVIAVAACVHEERRSVEDPVSAEARTTPASTSSRPQYLVADPSPTRGAKAVRLGGAGQLGIVVEKRRIVVGHGEPRVASDLASEAILGAERIPSRFGGGFLFWTASTLYRSEQFDASLVPIARVPDVINFVAFAPDALVVRTRNGERWGFSLPKGERAPLLPVGVADVEGLDDGRALGFNDQGAVFASIDRGAHWIDVTVQVKSPPARVSRIGDDLWLTDTNGGAYRLEPDGRLAWFDKAPSEDLPVVRSKDPRWRGTEAPLRAVFQGGAAIDDSTAIVIDSGDVYRVDVHTGEIRSVVTGRLPPEATCQAVPGGGDVVFACVSSTNGSAFVVSHTLSSEPPLIEQTLAPGGAFFASDDGGLVYTGPCNGVPPQQGSTQSVCVRVPGGRWEERDLSGLTADGGANDVVVTRWVPRADGHVVALVAEPSVGIYDPVSLSFQPIAEEAKEAFGRPFPLGLFRNGRLRLRRAASSGTGVVDSSWSFVGGGVLRGWQRHGEAIEISEDGKVTRSPYSFETVFAGPLGLGLSKDGRLYQSTDHGASWTEVAAPPSGIESVDLVSCTSAGCDLGAFYRVGWGARPPRIETPQSPAPPAPELRRVRGLELSCRPHGPVSSKALSRTDFSPEDLGLGVARLPVTTDENDWAYVRNPVPRTIASPVHDVSSLDDDGSPALRAMFTGFATTRDAGDVIVVTGPNKSAKSLRRGFSYVAPFDPSGRVVRATIAMSDVIAAGRRAGMTTDEVLAEDMTELGNVVPLVSPDPTQPSDVAVHNAEYGLITIVRGERVRVAIRSYRNGASIVSGVVLGADEFAFLEVESSGAGKVFKLAGGAMSELFDVLPPASETYYPANPDALAVGPKGELAILRTPSGSDPASWLDPAYIVVQAAAPAPLAPWSTLKLADDPACKADKDGWRATLQTIAPWIRVANPELRVEDAPMIARVRWSPKRVCLEGFEVKLPTATIQLSGPSGTHEPATFSTWLVGKGSAFARVGVAEGVEWRQPLECSIVATGP